MKCISYKLSALLIALSMMICLTGCGKKVVYTRGSWQDNVYTNTSLGFTLTMPDGWTAKSNEELMASVDSGYSALTDEQKKNYDSSKNKTVYDFIISNAVQNSTLQLTVENLSLTVGASGMKAEEYAKSLKEQLEQITSMTYQVGDPYTATLHGQEYFVLPTMVEEPTVEGEHFCQDYYIRKEGKLMTTFIATYLESNREDFKAFLEENLKAAE